MSDRPRRMFLGLAVDNLIGVLTLIGSMSLGIYEVGGIKTALEDGIRQEHVLREAELAGVASQIAALQKTIEETHSDIRELRSYMMVDHQFGMRAPR